MLFYRYCKIRHKPF